MSARSKHDFPLQLITSDIFVATLWTNDTPVLNCFHNRDCVLVSMGWSWHASTRNRHNQQMKFYIYILPKHSPFDLVCLSAIDLVNAFARVRSIGCPWRLKIIVIFQEIFGSIRSSELMEWSSASVCHGHACLELWIFIFLTDTSLP